MVKRLSKKGGAERPLDFAINDDLSPRTHHTSWFIHRTRVAGLVRVLRLPVIDGRRIASSRFAFLQAMTKIATDGCASGDYYFAFDTFHFGVDEYPFNRRFG